MTLRLLRSLLLLSALAAPAAANDGFAGMTAAGLEFQKSDAIEMVTEDLTIGIDKISVDYTFRNTSGADVTGLVAFPMPPFSISTFQFTATRFTPADLDKENSRDFTALVDGQPVAIKIERKAFKLTNVVPQEDPNEPGPSASAEYDDPGEDITAYLTGLGIPISYDPATIMAALDKLTPEQARELEAKDLAIRNTQENTPELRWVIGWALSTRYYWEQTFPAGKTVTISHSYNPHPAGGLYYWHGWTKPDENFTTDPNGEDKVKYCIDEATGQAIAAALPADPNAGGARGGTAFYLQYVLTTATTWKGPIGRFKLTLDKGTEKNVLSVCLDGLKKTGLTQFTVERERFSPDKDLEILIVTADPAFPQ